MDQIQAKYEQLHSGKFGAVGTLAFNAETYELANLLAHVSQLCQKLNTCSCEPTLPETEPTTSKGTLQANILQAYKMLFGSKLQVGSLVRVWRMQLCL